MAAVIDEKHPVTADDAHRVSLMASTRTKQWGWAWVALAVALGLHVADEATTGFLPLYNSIVGTLRESYPWIPLPTFSFGVWLAGLIVGVLALLLLSPLVFAGNRYLRPLSYVLGTLMILNALAHIGGSIYLGAPAPGAVSSPLLLLTAAALLVTTCRAGHSASGDGNVDDAGRTPEHP